MGREYNNAWYYQYLGFGCLVEKIILYLTRPDVYGDGFWIFLSLQKYAKVNPGHFKTQKNCIKNCLMAGSSFYIGTRVLDFLDYNIVTTYQKVPYDKNEVEFPVVLVCKGTYKPANEIWSTILAWQHDLLPRSSLLWQSKKYTGAQLRMLLCFFPFWKYRRSDEIFRNF